MLFFVPNRCCAIRPKRHDPFFLQQLKADLAGGGGNLVLVLVLQLRPDEGLSDFGVPHAPRLKRAEQVNRGQLLN